MRVFAGFNCETIGSVDDDHQFSRIGVAFGPGEIFISGPASEVVDAELVRWLEGRGVPEQSLVAVGWSVAGCRLSCLRRKLPAFSSRYLSNGTVALDAVCYALADNKTYGDSPTSFEQWEAMAKRAAELYAKIGYEMDPAPDDAGYLALTSLLAWRWLCAIVADPQPATWSGT